MPPSLDARVVMSLSELFDASHDFVDPHIATELARARTPLDMQDLVQRVMLMIVDYSHGLDKYVMFSALEDDAKNMILGHPRATADVRALLVRISSGAWTSRGRLATPFDPVRTDGNYVVPETPHVDERLVIPFDPIRTSDNDVVPETPHTSEDEYTSWQPCQRRRILMERD